VNRHARRRDAKVGALGTHVNWTIGFAFAPLLVAACGAPFEANIPDARELVEGGGADVVLPTLDGNPPEGGADVLGMHEPDAGHRKDAEREGGAAPLEASAHDAAERDAPVEAACVLALSAPTICDGITAADYCVQVDDGEEYFQAPAPAECQCASSYTCACVDVLPDPCNGHGTYAHACFMQGGVPIVECIS
jgi:hypothetical protein